MNINVLNMGYTKTKKSIIVTGFWSVWGIDRAKLTDMEARSAVNARIRLHTSEYLKVRFSILESPTNGMTDCFILFHFHRESVMVLVKISTPELHVEGVNEIRICVKFRQTSRVPLFTTSNEFELWECQTELVNAKGLRQPWVIGLDDDLTFLSVEKLCSVDHAFSDEERCEVKCAWRREFIFW